MGPDRYWFLDVSVPGGRVTELEIHDRRSQGEPIAECDDVAVAERLVRLLNEDERHKARMAFLRGAALPSNDFPIGGVRVWPLPDGSLAFESVPATVGRLVVTK